MNPILKDPMVVEALRFRPAEEISLLRCHKCNQVGYWDGGDWFTCTHCGTKFYVLGEGEPQPQGQVCMYAFEAMPLSEVL